jgi:hypothetical protein
MDRNPAAFRSRTVCSRTAVSASRRRDQVDQLSSAKVPHLEAVVLRSRDDQLPVRRLVQLGLVGSDQQPDPTVQSERLQAELQVVGLLRRDHPNSDARPVQPL